MSYNMNLAESFKVVNCLPATPGSAATHTGDYISMKNASHIDYLVSFGTTAATSTIKVYEACTAAGASATVLAFDYYKEETDTGDTLDDRVTAVAAAGITVPTTDKIFYVISVDSDTMAENKKWISLTIKMAGNNAACAMAVLSGLRYSPTVTAIT